MVNLYQQQLEREMRDAGVGVENYYRRLGEKGAFDTLPGRTLARVLVEPLGQLIEEWTSKPAGRGASLPRLLTRAKPNELAYLTLKATLSALLGPSNGKGRDTGVSSYARTAVRLGGLVEEHLMWRELLAGQSTRAYARAAARRIKTIAHEGHARAAARSVGRRLRLPQWNDRQRAKVGIHLLERLLLVSWPDGSPAFETHTTGTGRRARKVVVPSPKTEEWLVRNHTRAAEMEPFYGPMLVPPRNWTDVDSGGYLTRTSCFGQPLCITRGLSRDDMAALRQADLSDIFEATNALQRVPWAVNHSVHEVARVLIEEGGQLAKLPAAEDTPLPAKNWRDGEEPPPEVLAEWKLKARATHEGNIKRVSRRIEVARKLGAVNDLAQHERFYFVWSTDFRGRLYPLASRLHPQDDDLGKALLRFADGKPLGESGVFWLAVHLANCAGVDKVSFDERVEWVLDNHWRICEQARDPLDGDRWWAEQEKPWQFLAACFEWAWASAHGFDRMGDYVSHLPINVDGSCNGLQHYSAMLRDPIGGAATNLVPSAAPADVYQQVADRTVELLEADDSEDARWWAGKVTRKLVKRPCMTVPYSVTAYGINDQLYRSALKEELFKEGDKTAMPRVQYLGESLLRAIGDTVVGAREAMEWLKECAQLVNQGLLWTSPSGFPSLQCYRHLAGERVGVMVAGRRVTVQLTRELGKLNSRKQAAAVAPNFVHSQDAAHLVASVRLATANGVEALAMVHDSYATHAANVEVLNRALREAFVEMYSANALEDWRQEVQERTGVGLPPPPAQGSLDVAQVLESDYFFA